MRVERKDFYIEYPGEFNARLVHPLIHYNTHRFKRLKDVDILSRKSKDPTIESVFECSHANSTGCACKFVLRNDNTGELVGAHKEDTNHLNDIHSWRLYIAKTCLYNDILNEPFTSPQKLLDTLLTTSTLSLTSSHLHSPFEERNLAVQVEGLFIFTLLF